MSVDTRHKDYTACLPDWQLVDDVIEGERHVKSKGARYLPLLSGHESENDDRYLAYKTRATLYNATGRTLEALTGMVFRKDPTQETGALSDDLLEDVNLSGLSLRDIAEQALEQVLRKNRCGLLVDHTAKPNEEGDRTVAEAEAAGERPKIVMYDAKDIINWRYEVVRGRRALVMVVLEEKYQHQIDAFQTEDRTQWRVLRLDQGRYVQQLWRKETQNQAAQMVIELTPRVNRAAMNELPFFFVSANGSGRCEKSPLLDLATMNISHYRTNADYEQGVHYTALPTCNVFGVDPEDDERTFAIGGDNVNYFEQSDAKAEWMELTGHGLGQVVKALERKEQQMGALGARMLLESPRGVETAEATQTKAAGEHSVLGSAAAAVSKQLTRALNLFGEWAGRAGDYSVELNRDYFPRELNPAVITSLVTAVQAGLMSRETFVWNMKQGELLQPERDVEEELAAAEVEALPPPRAGPGQDDDEDDEPPLAA